MDKFACIKFLKAYERVIYYSIVIDGLEIDKSLFEEFVENNIKNKNKLNHILDWIKLIGNQYGALDHLFRHEKEANALPPPGTSKEPTYIENDNITLNNLRLYCHRLNENVVVLFSGNIKTTRVAQDCPNVAEHFHIANRLVNAIDEAMRSGAIEWADDFSDILYEENLKINF